MKRVIFRNATSVILQFYIIDTSGSPKTGLLHSTADLKIVLRGENEASFTKYLQSASNVETITTPGTFAAPTTNKCRFKEVDSTDAKGFYEVQFANAIWTKSANMISGKIECPGCADTPFEIQLVDSAQGLAGTNLDAAVSSRADTNPDNSGIADAAASADSADTKATNITNLLNNGTYGLSALHDDLSANIIVVAQILETVGLDLYIARVSVSIDETNEIDKYGITWLKNFQNVGGGLSAYKISVICIDDNSVLINDQSLTDEGSGNLTYDATTSERITAGRRYKAIITTTIDGDVRVWPHLFSRDSAGV